MRPPRPERLLQIILRRMCPPTIDSAIPINAQPIVSGHDAVGSTIETVLCTNRNQSVAMTVEAINESIVSLFSESRTNAGKSPAIAGPRTMAHSTGITKEDHVGDPPDFTRRMALSMVIVVVKEHTALPINNPNPNHPMRTIVRWSSRFIRCSLPCSLAVN